MFPSPQQPSLRSGSSVRLFSSLKLFPALILALAFIAGPTESAQAQCADRVMLEIHRTDDILQRVKSKLQDAVTTLDLTSANAERAKSLLTIAFKMQEEAKKACGGGDGRTALQLTIEARDKARGALGSINQTNDSEPALERQLLQTDELLARLQENIPPDAPRPLRARFERAVETQRRAWEMFRSGHPRMALKLTKEAQRQARAMIRDFRDHGRLADQLKRRFETISQMLQRAHERAGYCENPEALELLKKAEDALKEAQALFADGHPRQAEAALQLARELAQKARRLCGEGKGLQRRIEMLKSRSADLRERAEGNEDALKLIDSADKNIAQAERLLADGMTQAAAGQLRAAELLLRQAQQRLGI